MKRVVVVLPLTPVTATTGIRPFSPGANMLSMIASPTGRGFPDEGSMCIRRPGLALTSTTMPPWLSSGWLISTATTSTPATSRPIILAASIARAATSGWTRSVTSAAVPPVLKLALRRMSTCWPAGGNRIGRVALFGQDIEPDRVELDFAEHRGVIVAAARVAIDLVDQFANRRVAVADDLGRLAAGGRHHAVAYDQQAIVGSGGETFDHHISGFFASGVISGDDLLARRKVGGYAAPLAAILRFDDHRHANFLGGFPGVFRVGHRAPFGHRHTHGPQQRARQFFVLGDRLGHGAGAIGLSGQDAALASAVAQLDQAFRIEPADRNTPFDRGLNDGVGARAQADFLVQFAEGGQFGFDVERQVADGGVEHAGGRFPDTARPTSSSWYSMTTL